MLISLLLLAQSAAPAAPPIVSLEQPPPRAWDARPADVLFEDRRRGIEVRYSVDAESVVFSANLPAEWGFSVDVDGDRNGRWGNGPEAGPLTSATSGDWGYAQDSESDAFCPYYILTSAAGNPAETYSVSQCGGFQSRGRIELAQRDAALRATVTYRIPAEELFGAHQDARLRVCVWDGRRSTCQHSISQPFVLRRGGEGGSR